MSNFSPNFWTVPNNTHYEIVKIGVYLSDYLIAEAKSLSTVHFFTHGNTRKPKLENMYCLGGKVLSSWPHVVVFSINYRWTCPIHWHNTPYWLFFPLERFDVDNTTASQNLSPCWVADHGGLLQSWFTHRNSLLRLPIGLRSVGVNPTWWAKIHKIFCF